MHDHSHNQMHGKSFENIIKATNCIVTSAATDRERSSNSKLDIDGSDDRAHGLPTSIKSSKTNMVGLSDARQFWQSFDLAPYRMLVGRYRQE